MIECKFGEIIAAKPAIEKLMTKQLSIKTLINLNKLIERFNTELKIIDIEKNKILTKYSEQSEQSDSNPLGIKEENIQQFQKEMNELLEVGVTIAEIDKLNLKDIEDIKLNYEEYLQLKPFLE